MIDNNNQEVVKFFSLSSGSAGNCYFLSLEENGEQTAGIIIDAGVSLRRLKKELSVHHYDYDSFSAILVTHDHMDHIRSLGSYCKKLSKPVYCTPELHKAMTYHPATKDWIGSTVRHLDSDNWNEIVPGKVFVKYFVVPHDASQTVGYAIWIGDYKFVIMTDLGRMTDEALAYARNAQTVVIESNYDTDMLLNGSYTYDLKMRICQGKGHLSNVECAEAIKQFYHQELNNVFLCHLSENNNTPELAFAASKDALESMGFKQSYPKSAVFVRDNNGNEEVVKLHALPRTTASTLFVI